MDRGRGHDDRRRKSRGSAEKRVSRRAGNEVSRGLTESEERWLVEQMPTLMRNREVAAAGSENGAELPIEQVHAEELHGVTYSPVAEAQGRRTEVPATEGLRRETGGPAPAAESRSETVLEKGVEHSESGIFVSFWRFG